MSERKYLLDEHVNPRLKRALIQREPDMVVWCIGDSGAPPIQTSDPDILLWCEEKGFTLVTYNRASMPVHLRDHVTAGKHIPGIFIPRRNMTMGQIIDELILIWGAVEPNEYTD